jgi:hypothetical protein
MSRDVKKLINSVLKVALIESIPILLDHLDKIWSRKSR